MSAKTKPETPALALTVEDAANALSLGYDAFKEHVWPELQIVRVGKRKMVAVTELQRWLDEHAESVL